MPYTQRLLAKLGEDLSQEQALLEEAEATAKKEDKALKDEEGALRKEDKEEKGLKKELWKGDMKHYWKDAKKASKHDAAVRGSHALIEQEDELLHQQVDGLADDAKHWANKQELHSLGQGASWFERSHAELELRRKQLAHRMQEFEKRQRKLDEKQAKAEKLRRQIDATVLKGDKHALQQARQEARGNVQHEQQLTRHGQSVAKQVGSALKDFEHLVQKEAKDVKKGESAYGHKKMKDVSKFEKDAENLEHKEQHDLQKVHDGLRKAREDEAAALTASKKWTAADTSTFKRLNQRHRDAEQRRAKIDSMIADLERRLREDTAQEGKVHESADAFRKRVGNDDGQGL